MVARDRGKRSIGIDQIGFITRVLILFEMTDCQKRSTLMEIGYKPHALHAQEQCFDSRMYQKAIGSILYAAPGTGPDVTYATPVFGRYAEQPSILHWEAMKHLLRYLQGTCDCKLTIYAPSLGRDSQSIVSYVDADFVGEADRSTSTSRIVVHAIGTLLNWNSKQQSTVAQSTMEAEMIATV